ncbi:hypothetical protein Fcan01_19221 [Folsomia candida]|uniref:Uncharacterized protein n=1 Tax=Folsomia candida TaxID=158441 RepID=A0A226DK05_FOLCA|nr:hypothetical protein Fcan01_19221 [Folsomia candida]
MESGCYHFMRGVFMGQDIASENKKIRTEEIAANMTRPERLEPLNLSKAISAVFIILGAMYPPIILVHLASSIYFYRERICKICFNNVFEAFTMCYLPPGNFGHFGPCVLKFVRLSDAFYYVDVVEHLIHANNPSTLIYTICGRPKFYNRRIHDKTNVPDFTFFEVCTVTIFVKFDTEDNQFRADYLYLTRDAHRSREHSVFILISHISPPLVKWRLSKVDYRGAHRIFALYLKMKPTITNSFHESEMALFFVCIWCRNRFHRVEYDGKVKSLTIRTFQKDWKPDIGIAVDIGRGFVQGLLCGKGQYYIAPSKQICIPVERKYLTIGNILNVTILQIPNAMWKDHDWGFYHVGYHHNRYFYSDIPPLYSIHYDGYHAIYCDFNVWSENSDLTVWLSPFVPEVWLTTCLIFLVALVVQILKHFLKPDTPVINLGLLKNLGEFSFAICAQFFRQTSCSSRIPKWIIVPLFFTSFMLIAQYELFLTGNLVVPPRVVILGTLSEFFANSYTLVFASEDIDGVVSPLSQLQEEFILQSLGNFPKEKCIVTGYQWKNETAYIKKHRPRTVVLLDNKLLAIHSHAYLRNIILKGQFKCFAIYDIALNEASFEYVDNMLRHEIGHSIKGLDQGGFSKLWDREIKHLIHLKAARLSKLRLESPYITINMLSSFFKAVGLSVLLLAAVAMVEVVLEVPTRLGLNRLIELS